MNDNLRNEDDVRNSELARNREEKDFNEDPLTGEPGAHPVGVGVGAGGAGLAGAAVGAAVGGPIGAAVGAVVGSVAGGYAGKAVAEGIDPTAEDAFWREAHRSEPYYDESRGYTYDEDYHPAYRSGYSGYAEHGENRAWSEAEPEIQREYLASRGGSRLDWNEARPASEAAWNRAASRRAGETQPGERGDDRSQATT